MSFVTRKSSLFPFAKTYWKNCRHCGFSSTKRWKVAIQHSARLFTLFQLCYFQTRKAATVKVVTFMVCAKGKLLTGKVAACKSLRQATTFPYVYNAFLRIFLCVASLFLSCILRWSESAVKTAHNPTTFLPSLFFPIRVTAIFQLRFYVKSTSATRF